MTSAHDDGNVMLQQLEPQRVLCIRATIRTEQLGEAMGERLQGIIAYLRHHGLQPVGPPYVRYHAFGQTEADFELGIPVGQAAQGEGPIASGALPGGPAATIWHLGAHDRLGDAYARLQAWLREQSREASSPAWEVYTWIDPTADSGPESWPEPAHWRTQIVQPLT